MNPETRSSRQDAGFVATEGVVWEEAGVELINFLRAALEAAARAAASLAALRLGITGRDPDEGSPERVVATGIRGLNQDGSPEASR